ncbi:TraR/DksA family transcriptional regulator [Niallia sp. Krafla_26]|uniref:TraR/DksA family transcriptional regulator n=1 Tax=Niallia sp. Krafla_26 TaxID=3064703 RepID=UPI003D17F998
MDPQYFEIYSELRTTKQELLKKIETGSSPLVQPYIEAELQDIDTAITKIENGTFGTCEVSGELIPDELLSIVPTLKSIDDCKTLQYLIHKSI